MITLTSDALLGDTLFHVDNPEEAALDDVLQVDVEYVVVRGSTASNALFVSRGAFGSTRAFHAQGAEVTPVQIVTQTAAPSAPPPTTAGTALALTRVGPLAVPFDLAGLNNPGDGLGPSILSVAAGSLIIAVGLPGAVPFDAPGDFQCSLGEGADTGAAALFDVDPSQIVPGVATNHAVGTLVPLTSAGNAPKWALASDDTHVRVAFFPSGGDATVGDIIIYCLIATPA